MLFDDALQPQLLGTMAEPFTVNGILLGVVIAHLQMLTKVLLRILQIKLGLRAKHDLGATLRGMDSLQNALGVFWKWDALPLME